MRFRNDQIIFNQEEQWVSGLPETAPLARVVNIFEAAWRARQACKSDFDELVLQDADERTPLEATHIPALSARLVRLDELSLGLGELAAPTIVDELLETL